MQGEHGILEKFIVVLWTCAGLAIGGYAIYVLTMFWVKFAQGINEANPPRRGFDVAEKYPARPDAAQNPTQTETQKI
jgi:hypothetical protein